jgi:hypothetical protein
MVAEADGRDGSTSANPSAGDRSMTSTEYAVKLARRFLAAETAMASVNSGAPTVTRRRAARLLDDYFDCLEQMVPWTEDNPLDRRS